ncbi:MAG TPA: extracellular solute-binding protein [Tepidisphaeraceae bacterium]|jgi:arabinosaccharide transport system substrate-binding protein|nr:extracellular solute-binding protein [Tepidisphaeraceae bacterium]
MSFHLGKPILVMIAAAIVGALVVAVRPSPRKTDTVLWIFAESHQHAYSGDPKLAGDPPAIQYSNNTGKSLDVVLMNQRAEDVRLVSIFNTHGRGQTVPDAVEVEISKIGKFFRPPVSDIGFLPLNDFLKQSGYYDQIVKARFAPWSKDGVIFGVPHDLHPSGITYRKDLYDQAGVDLAAAKTWREFQQDCLKFRRYWLAQGRPRWAIGLSRSSSDNITMLLQQRDINLVDDHNRIFINDPRVADTIRVYCDMVAGKEPAGTDFSPAPGGNYGDLANGDVCAMLTPDWMVGYIKIYRPDVAGKIAMMPLPLFDPTDHPTASWGGTMIGIPRDCKDPQASWKLIESIYFSHDSISYQRQLDQILPPLRKFWKDDIYQHGDPFFMNSQNVNQLFIQLADQLPVRYMTPYTILAQQLVADVQNKTVNRIDAGQTENLDQDIQHWLDDSAKTLDGWIKFGTFED